MGQNYSFFLTVHDLEIASSNNPMNICLTNKIVMNIAYRWHRYPINIVLGSLLDLQNQIQQGIVVWCSVCMTCRIQATEP